MAHFARIGKRIVNLDEIAHVTIHAGEDSVTVQMADGSTIVLGEPDAAQLVTLLEKEIRMWDKQLWES